MKDKLRDFLSANSKAIAAFVSTGAMFVADHFQHVVDPFLVKVLVGAGVSAVVVWLAPKNKKVPV